MAEQVPGGASMELMRHPRWEPFWQAVDEVQLALHCHTFPTTPPRARQEAPQVLRAAMFTGVSAVPQIRIRPFRRRGEADYVPERNSPTGGARTMSNTPMPKMGGQARFIVRPGKAARLLVSVITALTAFSAPPGNAAANAVIDLTYDSVMDMVRPEVHPGIAVHHNLQVTVSGGGNLSEGRNRSAGPYQDRNAMMQVLSSSGDDAAYASWRTAPDGRLVRIQNDPQSTRTMTVTLLPGNTCRLEVVDQLKPGFSEYAFLRISTHTIGYFSTYRVTRTSCAIH